MSHKVEILSVGTELLLGSTLTPTLRCSPRGVRPGSERVLAHGGGDNPQRAREAVELAWSRADIIITTGGLGPTCDDSDQNVPSRGVWEKAGPSPGISGGIKDYARVTGRPLTENNFQQALVPEGGSTVLVNDWGSAPGCAFEGGRRPCHHAPRPPSECRPMFHSPGGPLSPGPCPRGSSPPTL